MRKHNYEGLLSDVPIPHADASDMDNVASVASRYREMAFARAQTVKKQDTVEHGRSPLFEPLEQVPSGPTELEIREALLVLDAAVLRLYNLPAKLERQLLDYFRGEKRRGVGCDFGDYYPADFKSLVPLHKYISAGYRRSTVDDVAGRMRPGESPAVLAGLRNASRAFGEGD
jgi:hypothetical protein